MITAERKLPYLTISIKHVHNRTGTLTVIIPHYFKICSHGLNIDVYTSSDYKRGGGGRGLSLREFTRITTRDLFI